MSPCCGHPRRRSPTPARLPANPVVRNGVRLLYLGSGGATLKGAASGLSYHVSDHRRDFTARVEDVAGLLHRRDVILSPR